MAIYAALKVFPNVSLFLSQSKGVVALDLGRLATGYGMGAFSYVVSPSS